jgi:hypothetical protein
MATSMGADLFIENARHFCAWIEGQALNPVSGTKTAMRLLSSLYSEALTLPGDKDEADNVLGNPSQDDYTQMQKRFEGFSLKSIYLHNPANNHSDAKSMPFHEIIALIYKHIRHGLELYENGERDSAYQYWQTSFAERWGTPLAALIHALHHYANENSIL